MIFKRVQFLDVNFMLWCRFFLQFIVYDITAHVCDIDYDIVHFVLISVANLGWFQWIKTLCMINSILLTRAHTFNANRHYIHTSCKLHSRNNVFSSPHCTHHLWPCVSWGFFFWFLLAGEILSYVSEDLKGDRELVLECVAKDGNVLSSVPDSRGTQARLRGCEGGNLQQCTVLQVRLQFSQGWPRSRIAGPRQ